MLNLWSLSKLHSSLNSLRGSYRKPQLPCIYPLPACIDSGQAMLIANKSYRSAQRNYGLPDCLRSFRDVCIRQRQRTYNQSWNKDMYTLAFIQTSACSKYLRCSGDKFNDRGLLPRGWLYRSLKIIGQCLNRAWRWNWVVKQTRSNPSRNGSYQSWCRRKSIGGECQGDMPA